LVDPRRGRRRTEEGVVCVCFDISRGKKMDEEMEDFVGEFSESSEIDWDYEFDACQFYDFTRVESNTEAGEAARWFEIAGSYPPSRKPSHVSI
jgi:hypothetical protein